MKLLYNIIISFKNYMEVFFLLTFEHVSKIYKGQKRAVDDLNFQIEKGEFIVLIGPSGCGKTTTMKMINRLIEPTEGTIFLNGENIMHMDPVKLRRQIGYVIQQIGLFPHMTIEQNISLVPRLLKWSSDKQRERAKELLSLVDMTPDYLNRYPNELSGGQQQRIGVLRALAADQPLILMDEPFGALDPITRDSLQTEFKKLQRKLKKTIVFVTHDMDEAIKLADRIVIMKDGRVVQFDTPDEILRNPANEFVEEFIGKERLSQVRPHIQTVDQIMNPAPVTVTPNVSLTEAIKIMIHKYLALVKNLGIKSSIAERSYVTDFARVANANGKTDTKSCKQVMVEKIKLLSPKLVVPIGAEPRDAFSREISTVPNKYSSVPFSLNGVPDKTKQEGPVQYKKVPERINDLLFLH